MNNNEYAYANDAEFDNLLKTYMTDEPPEEIVKTVTPWKKAMQRVLIGLALSMVTLNLFLLDYILPAIGAVLSLLGFRTLRKENKQFLGCYVISLINLVYKLFVLIKNTAINIYEIIPGSFFLFTSSILTFIHLLLFCRSLYAVQKKAGITPYKTPMISLIIWYIVLCGLAFIEFSGLILPLLMIISLIFIIINLNKISKALDKAAYTIETAPIKISDRALVSTIAVTLAAGIACGYIFFGSYPMQWEVMNKNEHAEIAEIKNHLIDLGFPAHILDDMSAEDILACQGATNVVVDTKEIPFNDGREIKTVKNTDDGRTVYIETVYDVKEMIVTGIGVCLNENMEFGYNLGLADNWIIIHHFQWVVNPGFYGTECIQLWPAYSDNQWSSAGAVTGRVLYTKDGTDYVSPYYSLGDETYTYESFITNTRTSTDIFATFSLPEDAENQRGYVTYSITANTSENIHLIDSWFNYNHQTSWLQYPARTAKENRQTGIFNDNIAFMTQQDALQIWDDLR